MKRKKDTYNNEVMNVVNERSGVWFGPDSVAEVYFEPGESVSDHIIKKYVPASSEASDTAWRL